MQRVSFVNWTRDIVERHDASKLAPATLAGVGGALYGVGESAVGAFGTVGMLVASGSYSTSESSGSSPSATGTAATASVSGPNTLIGSFRSAANVCAETTPAAPRPMRA